MSETQPPGSEPNSDDLEFDACVEQTALGFIRRDGLNRRAAEVGAREAMRHMPRWKDDARLVDYPLPASASTPILDGLQPLPASTTQAPLTNGTLARVALTAVVAAILIVPLSHIRAGRGDTPLPQYLVAVFTAAIVAVYVTHALFVIGSLLAALVIRFRIQSVALFPLSLTPTAKGWLLTPLSSYRFCVVALPRTPERLRARMMLFQFSGTIAAFIAVIAGVAILFAAAPTTSTGGTWFLLTVSFLVVICVTAIIGVCLPFAGSNTRANILTTISRAGAKRTFALPCLQESILAGTSYADLNRQLLDDALAVHDQSSSRVLANLIAFSWALSRRDIQAGRWFLEVCLENSHHASEMLRRIILASTVEYEAWCEEDLDRATRWHDLAQSTLLHATAEARARLESTLAWARGDYPEAQEKFAEWKQVIALMPEGPIRRTTERIGATWEAAMSIRLSDSSTQ